MSSTAPAPAEALFPAIAPYASEHLAVSDGHTLYVEQCGNPAGLPVLFLHGGPGGGCSELSRRFFDPDRCRVVLFDQRGCGRSRPFASLEANTTWHLVEDIERLRRHLGVERWLLFGGSWGSTLALAYAERYPERALGLVLRGVFCATLAELDWFYRGGTAQLFPDAWEAFVAPLPEVERADPLAAWQRRLRHRNADIRQHAARIWTRYEFACAQLRPPAGDAVFSDDFALAFASIEAHYFIHEAWLAPDQLYRELGAVRHLPCAIVQGRYDAICPPATAWRVHRAWPGSALTLIDDAGHSAMEPGITRGLVAAVRAVAEQAGAW
jgi:proline iminopeptidase